MNEKELFDKRWQLATAEQRERYQRLLEKYQHIEWTDKEKTYLLWLCQMDIDTLSSFEGVFEKLSSFKEID